jgi:hypothetical protein
MKRIYIGKKWYIVNRETAFNGVKHYGIASNDSLGKFCLGWVPEWLVDKVEEL